MQTPLAKLNEADQSRHDVNDIRAKLSASFLNELRVRFGVVGENNALRQRLGKVLVRYHAAALHALLPHPAPQTKELKKLQKAIERTLSAFEVISDENRYSIDDKILYREPFNGRFCFKEQCEYWDKNEDTFRRAGNALTMISFAISKIETEKREGENEIRRTKNRPLDSLIEDLTFDFENGRDRQARRCCYYDSSTENYAGQFFDFILFLLRTFAPSSYHSENALGQRIRRVLARVDSNST